VLRNGSGDEAALIVRPGRRAVGQSAAVQQRCRRLVSTADDFLTFARMLLAGGVHLRRRLLSEALVTAMTTNQLASEQVSGIDPNGTLGWGFGVGVQLRQVGRGQPVGAYGWDGGLGTCWSNDPGHGLAMVLLTNQMWTSPTPGGGPGVSLSWAAAS
jgi:CubicO group peptidase (beta-lactamase class C family)